jgi:hypothetical protein
MIETQGQGAPDQAPWLRLQGDLLLANAERDAVRGELEVLRSKLAETEELFRSALDERDRKAAQVEQVREDFIDELAAKTDLENRLFALQSWHDEVMSDPVQDVSSDAILSLKMRCVCLAE